MKDLDTIARLIPPPAHPIHAGTPASWSEIQKRYGGLLPECLSQFGRRYGSGDFVGGLHTTIFNPYDPAYDSNVRLLCNIYNDLRDMNPDCSEWHPYPCHPEPNGLLPVAWGDEHQVHILLSEYPEQYTVIFHNPSQDYVEFPYITLIDFLDDFFCNKVHKNFFYEPITFRPQPLVFRKGNVYGEP